MRMINDDFVYSQLFVFSKVYDFNENLVHSHNLLETADEYDNIKVKHWLKYWEENGNNIVYANWKQMYGAYLDDGNSYNTDSSVNLLGSCENDLNVKELETSNECIPNVNAENITKTTENTFLSDKIEPSIITSSKEKETLNTEKSFINKTTIVCLEGNGDLNETSIQKASERKVDVIKNSDTQIEIFSEDIPKFDENLEAETTSWESLWNEHYSIIYNQQFDLFESVFFDYYSHYTKTLTKYYYLQEDKEETNQELYETFTYSSDELKSLGLPTSFGVKKKFNSNFQQISYLSEESNSFLVDSLSDNEQSNLSVSKPTLENDQSSSFFLESNSDNNQAQTVYEESTSDNEQLSDNSSFDLSFIFNSDDMKLQVDSTLQNNDELPSTEHKKNSKKKKNCKNRKLKSVPKEIIKDKKLIKYWRRRFSLFSRYDEGIRLDRESWFSVTPEKVAIHLAKRMKCDLIIDAFCGSGGNTIQFAKTCGLVIAIDIDPEKIEMARHNAKIYGVESNIEFIVGDYTQLYSSLKADMVFLSPPWGGPVYNKENYDIEEFLKPLPATELVAMSRQISENVALFLPRASNRTQVIKIAGLGKQVEIENNYLDQKLVAITAFYGNALVGKNDD